MTFSQASIIPENLIILQQCCKNSSTVLQLQSNNSQSRQDPQTNLTQNPNVILQQSIRSLNTSPTFIHLLQYCRNLTRILQQTLSNSSSIPKQSLNYSPTILHLSNGPAKILERASADLSKNPSGNH